VLFGEVIDAMIPAAQMVGSVAFPQRMTAAGVHG
jgi:hypothetical protein